MRHWSNDKNSHPRVLNRDDNKRNIRDDDNFDMRDLYKEIHENMRPPPDTSVYRDYRFNDHPFDYKVDAQYVSIYWKDESVFKTQFVMKKQANEQDQKEKCRDGTEKVGNNKIEKKVDTNIQHQEEEEDLPAPKGTKIFAYV